jgi:hypothetical protein
VKCSRCQHDNPPGSNFCLGCGTRLGATCGACGNELPAGSRFCNKCGTPASGGTPAGPARFASPEAYTPRHLAERINSGEVVVRSIGSDLRTDYTAVGQTTHLAARMEQGAAPGTILLAPATLALWPRASSRSRLSAP